MIRGLSKGTGTWTYGFVFRGHIEGYTGADEQWRATFAHIADQLKNTISAGNCAQLPRYSPADVVQVTTTQF